MPGTAGSADRATGSRLSQKLPRGVGRRRMMIIITLFNVENVQCSRPRPRLPLRVWMQAVCAHGKGSSGGLKRRTDNVVDACPPLPKLVTTAHPDRARPARHSSSAQYPIHPARPAPPSATCLFDTHHLFPNYSYAYYNEITDEIKLFAKEHQFNYKQFPITVALRKHYELLESNATTIGEVMEEAM